MQQSDDYDKDLEAQLKQQYKKFHIKTARGI